MPRGNCETIAPRALTLARVRGLLDARPAPHYGDALELMRRQRVDLNLLHDHAPDAFSVHSAMLAGVGDVAAAAAAACAGSSALRAKAAAACGHDRWDLFLSALDEEDCTAGKYAPPFWYTRPPPPPAAAAAAASQGGGIPAAVHAADPTLAALLLGGATATGASAGAGSGGSGGGGGGRSKISRACATLRAALLHAMCRPENPPPLPPPAAPAQQSQPQQLRVHWLHPLVLSVVTSFARQAPADLESVLAVVRRAAEAEAAAKHDAAALRAQGPPKSASSSCVVPAPADVSSEAVLAHALLVCDGDVELLYTTALGVYSLPLANALAQRGQTDPREYGPFLRALAEVRVWSAATALPVLTL